MQTNTLTSPISALINQFELQTKLFNNVLAGVPEEHSHKNIKEDTNHLAWLTGHVLSSRYSIANIIGMNEKEPHPELFGNSKGLQKGAKYPPLKEMVKDWDGLSARFLDKLRTLGDTELSAKSPFPLPMSGQDLKACIAFFSHHEAYTIGQMGLLRRVHNLPGMTYN